MASAYQKGYIDNPYTQEEFESLLNSHEWSGGWVHNYYYKLYSSEGRLADESGSMEQPFTMDVYNEMRVRNSWLGGYVMIRPNTVVYKGRFSSDDEDSGSGCGCNSGSGESSGGGVGSGIFESGPIRSGSEYFMYILLEETFRCKLSWGDGTFGPTTPYPPLSVDDIEYTSVSPTLLEHLSLSVRWERPFVVKITLTDELCGKGSQSVEYSIPEHYRRNS